MRFRATCAMWSCVLALGAQGCSGEAGENAGGAGTPPPFMPPLPSAQLPDLMPPVRLGETTADDARATIERLAGPGTQTLDVMTWESAGRSFSSTGFRKQVGPATWELRFIELPGLSGPRLYAVRIEVAADGASSPPLCQPMLAWARAAARFPCGDSQRVVTDTGFGGICGADESGQLPIVVSCGERDPARGAAGSLSINIRTDQLPQTLPQTPFPPFPADLQVPAGPLEPGTAAANTPPPAPARGPIRAAEGITVLDDGKAVCRSGTHRLSEIATTAGVNAMDDCVLEITGCELGTPAMGSSVSVSGRAQVTLTDCSVTYTGNSSAIHVRENGRLKLERTQVTTSMSFVGAISLDDSAAAEVRQSQVARVAISGRAPRIRASGSTFSGGVSADSASALVDEGENQGFTRSSE